MVTRTLVAYLLILLVGLGLAAALWLGTREHRAVAGARRRRRRARREGLDPTEHAPDSILVKLADPADSTG